MLVDVVLLNSGGGAVILLDLVAGAGDCGWERSTSIVISGVRCFTVRLPNLFSSELEYDEEDASTARH